MFENEILTGEWSDDDSATWVFEHGYNGDKKPENIDKKSYVLKLTDEEGKKSEFDVNIVKLGDYYFLDFYLDDVYDNNELDLAAFHVIPVHTFAKLEFSKNRLEIHWFDQNWLEDLIEANKIRIHHENNGDFILLTAKPKELQKFVTKYVNSEEAFKDGIEAVLSRK